MSDSQRIANALKLYADEMRSYILDKLQTHYGQGRGWMDAYLSSFRSQQRRDNVVYTLERIAKEQGEQGNFGDIFDIVHLKDLLLSHRALFEEDFQRAFNRAVTWADEIAEVRHQQAHQLDIPEDDIHRALDSMARMLTNIGANEAAQQMKVWRDSGGDANGDISGDISGEKAEASLLAQPTAAASALGSWWQYAEPHSDIKQGGFDESTFAAKLDDVVAGHAAWEYQRAEEFFAKTYMTRELRALLCDSLRRLAGSGGEAVVQLRTAFGGGKTHTLIALYHLVNSAADVEDMPDIRQLLREAGLEHIPHARVAVAVGHVPPTQAQNLEEGVTAHSLWGWLAYQLGGAEGYAMLQDSDQAQVSPSKDSLRALLTRYGRVLFLLDELLVYLVRAGGIAVGESTLRAQTLSFLQTLTELVSSMPGVALVTTFPESHLEYYDQNHEQVFHTLGKIFGRVEATRVPVQGEEVFEVVRRRLFSNIDENHAKQVVAAYQQLYTEHASDLPDSVRSTSYAERMRRAFPFHPEVIDVLYERWGTLQSFQKTRGVLRLLARVIEHHYMAPAAGPLISLADMGLDNPDLRGAVAQILRGGNWEPVIVSDIVPPSGKAFVTDKERGGEYARLRLCQGVTTAIFMYSHSGGGEQGAQESRLRLALLQPQGLSPTLLSDVLARLKGRLYYLYGNGGWSFRVQPNLNAVLHERMGQVKSTAIRTALREALIARNSQGVFKLIVWPEESRDVPDSSALKLVLLAPELCLDDDIESGAANELERQRYNLQQHHGSGPRLHKNTLLYASGRRADFMRAHNIARELLALEMIEKERLALSADQKQELRERLQRLRDTLPDAIKAAYSLVYAPNRADGKEYRHHDLSADVKTASSINEALSKVLKNADVLLEALDPALLLGDYLKLWPAEDSTINLRSLRDFFWQFPHLPYLISEQVLKDSIVRGVRNGLFELVLSREDAEAKVWRSQHPPDNEDIFFAEHYLLAKLGVYPPAEPAPTPPTPEPRKPGENPNGGGPEPVTAGNIPRTNGKSPKSSVVQCLRLHVPHCTVEALPQIIDVVDALEGANGRVHISLTIKAEGKDAAGLNEGMLEMNVRELLLQYGLEADWQTEKG